MPGFRTTANLVIAILVVASVSAGAAPSVGHWRKIGNTPGFPGLHNELQRIIKNGSHDKEAVFCVMLDDTGDRERMAYAIWENKHLLYRWYTTREPALSDSTLLYHGPIDLQKDIIRTKTDRLSSFLVTRSWAKDIEAQCHQHGEQVAITRGEK